MSGVSINTVDEIAQALIRTGEVIDTLRDAERAIKARVASMVSSANVTQRVRGETFEIDVTQADVSWDDSALKRVWEDSPQALRDEILRVSKVAVNAKTWKVWEKTTGTDEFEHWKGKIKSACRGRTGMPAVRVVKGRKASDNPF